MSTERTKRVALTAGIEAFGIVGGPSCGKDLDGFSFGVGGDVAAPGLPGLGSIAGAVGGGASGLIGGLGGPTLRYGREPISPLLDMRNSA